MDEIAEKMRMKAAADFDSSISNVNKVLRSVKSCNALDWDNPCADEVYDRIFVGNRLSALDVEYMKKLGITHLLNCAHPGPEVIMSVNVDEAALAEAGIKYLGLNLDDNEDQEIGSQFQKTGEWINEAITQDDNNKVLINCWAGISRSSTIATAYLMRHRDLSLLQALKYIKSVRNVQPNTGFMLTLLNYEFSIQESKRQCRHYELGKSHC